MPLFSEATLIYHGPQAGPDRGPSRLRVGELWANDWRYTRGDTMDDPVETWMEFMERCEGGGSDVRGRREQRSRSLGRYPRFTTGRRLIAGG